MTTLAASPAVDFAISEAKSLPTLISNLQAIDPDLTKQFETKPLLASRTPWGVLLASLIGMAAARFGIGLDTDTDALLSGGLVLLFTLAGSYLMRLVTKQPVAGVVSTPATIASAPPAAAGPLVLALGVGLSLVTAACTPAQLATTLADGQLVCQTGAAYQAMSAMSGQAILAKDATAQAVQRVCGLIGGIPVALPIGTTPTSAAVPAAPGIAVAGETQ